MYWSICADCKLVIAGRSEDGWRAAKDHFGLHYGKPYQARVYDTDTYFSCEGFQNFTGAAEWSDGMSWHIFHGAGTPSAAPDWEDAKQALDKAIRRFLGEHPSGLAWAEHVVTHSLKPLMLRYDSGERTEALLREMRLCH